MKDIGYERYNVRPVTKTKAPNLFLGLPFFSGLFDTKET